MFRIRSVVWRLLRLAAPVALARLGIMAMSVVDVMVVGQYAPAQIPHLALGWAPIGVLLVAGIVAAALSSATTFLSLVGFSASHDIVQRDAGDE